MAGGLISDLGSASMKFGTGAPGYGKDKAVGDPGFWNDWFQSQGFVQTNAGAGVSGWVKPGAQPKITDPTDSLRTSVSGLVDTTLGSRAYMNPNVGQRDVLASGSVYQQANVPAYLTNAVTALNRTQAEREANQEAYRRNLLAMYMSAGPNSYLLAPAVAASGVAPGRSVSISGRAFENPLVGEGENALDTSTATAVSTLNSDIASRERRIADLKQQIKTAWGPTANNLRGQLTIELTNEEDALRNLRNSEYAQNVSGWVGNVGGF